MIYYQKNDEYKKIEDKLIEIAKTTQISVSILNKYFFNKTPDTNIEEDELKAKINLLSTYINTGVKLNHYFLYKDEDKYDGEDTYCALIALLLDMDTLSLKYDAIPLSIFKGLLSVIMDLYIPDEDKDNTVEAVLFVVSNNLSEVIGHLYDTKWLVSKNPNITAKSELLFNYFSDVYSHPDMKYSVICDLYNLNEKKKFLVAWSDMKDRLSQYYPDYIGFDIISSEMMRILTNENVECHIFELLYDLTDTLDKKFIDIFFVTLREVNYMLKVFNTIDSITYNSNDELIRRCEKNINDNLCCNDSNECMESYSSIKGTGIDFACEAFKKDSVAMKKSSDKIYRAYKSYKNAEDKVDAQITKAVKGMGKVLTGDVRTEIIEGKKFSALSLLKKLLGGVALFSVAPIKSVILLVVRYALKKNVSISERKKIIMELETEIEIIDEKINDAQGDNNRQAKYAMMRTRSELKNALKRIEYGLEADSKSLAKASAVLNQSKSQTSNQ